jgi:hypothetical protein
MYDKLLIPYEKDSSFSREYGSFVLQSGIYAHSRPSISLSKTLDGFRCPNWKELIKNGQDATTPISLATEQSLVSKNLPVLTYTRSVSGKVHDCRQNMWGINPTIIDLNGGSHPSVAEAFAIKAVNNKIKNSQKPINAQVMLGEARETLRLLRRPLSQSTALIKSFMKNVHDIKSTARRSKDVVSQLSRSWLEFRFAILPLCSDIEDIIAVLEKDGFERTHVKGVGASGFSTVQTTASSSWIHGSSTVVRTCDYLCNVIIRAGLIESIDSRQKGLKEVLNENLTDFSEVGLTLWELTPWSFLIDYFVNVEALLTSYSFDYKSLTSYTSKSVVQTTTTKYEAVTYVPGAQVSVKSLSGNWPPSVVIKSKRLSRNVVSSLIPPLVFTIPGSNIKLANIAALSILKLQGK